MVAARRFLRTKPDARTAERVRFALLAATGRHTLEELAQRAGRSRSTIQNWVEKFSQGGLAGLLARDTAPGVASPLAARTIQQQLRSGLQAGQWTSAAQVAAWLKDVHGITRSRKSIYYWLEKFRLRAPGRDPGPARPVRGG